MYPLTVDLGASWRGTVSSAPAALPPLPGEGAHGTRWIRGCWVSPRTGLDDVEKIKVLPLPVLES
jgi:hypothetical protein